MTGEMGFIDGDILNTYRSYTGFKFDNPIYQEKRITMR
jgi:hypothetical protein